jgi:hypothetical protein
MLKPRAFALPLRSPDRLIAPVLSTVSSLGIRGRQMCSSDRCEPPGRYGEKRIPFSVPIVNIPQHFSKLLAGTVKFSDITENGLGGLMRLFSSGRDASTPPARPQFVARAVP